MGVVAGEVGADEVPADVARVGLGRAEGDEDARGQVLEFLRGDLSLGKAARSGGLARDAELLGDLVDLAPCLVVQRDRIGAALTGALLG